MIEVPYKMKSGDGFPAGHYCELKGDNDLRHVPLKTGIHGGLVLVHTAGTPAGDNPALAISHKDFNKGESVVSYYLMEKGLVLGTVEKQVIIGLLKGEIKMADAKNSAKATVATEDQGKTTPKKQPAKNAGKKPAAKTAPTKDAGKGKTATKTAPTKDAGKGKTATKTATKTAPAATRGDGGGRGRPSPYAGKTIIAVQKDNPQRPGSKRFTDYAIIMAAGKKGIKFEDFVAQGGTPGYIKVFAEIQKDKVTIK